MRKEMLLERVLNQTRLAVLEDGRLCEIYYERGAHAKLAGNIYAGRVQNVLPGMNAAFVDIGLSRNAFLYAGDIGIDTREEQALTRQLAGARIEKMLRPGQMIVCQVVKEPGGSKGPRISGSITLAGRDSVLLPTIRYAGVSKKIDDADERERLFHIAEGLANESGAGIIVRTAGEGASAAEIRADYDALRRMWTRIEAQARHSAAPGLIQRDAELTLYAVRDLLDDEVAAVRTDDAALYDELCAHARNFVPELVDRIRLERTQTPLFDLKRVDHQLEKAFNRRVYLGSGGTLVIDETEALTVIDVNTGKFVGKASLDDTIYRLNCEAAAEIARQIRLRDIGGIIIIDFIDMDDPAQRAELIEQLRLALKSDRNRTNVLGMTNLGLVEMTRKKLRKPLSKLITHDCAQCQGVGRVPTQETLAYEIAREIWRRRRAGDDTAYRVRAGEALIECLGRIGLAGDGRLTLETGGAQDAYEILPDGSEA